MWARAVSMPVKAANSAASTPARMSSSPTRSSYSGTSSSNCHVRQYHLPSAMFSNVRLPEPKETLTGGNMAGEVLRVGDTVRRRAGPWTQAVHQLLRHLEQVDFQGAPRAL